MGQGGVNGRDLPSVLFPDPVDAAGIDDRPEPGFFGDVNLDQVVAAVVAGRDEYRLVPYFRAALSDVDAVVYRQQVMRDLDGMPLAGQVAQFGRRMQAVRRGVAYAGKVASPQVAWRWVADSAVAYAGAVEDLGRRLGVAELASAGMRGFRDYLAGYLRSARYTAMAAEARQVVARLDGLDFSLTVKGPRIQVRRFTGEDDYATQVEDTFARFRHGAVKDYRAQYRDTVTVGHIEAQVLERVARLFPDEFAALRDFCARHPGFVDDTVALFDRQVQFYLAWLDYLGPLRAAGLAFCYPLVSARVKAVDVRGVFDIALAAKLVSANQPVVGNDVRLDGAQRMVVVTGPNQGGKTTYARAIGQVHHLARLGLPVAGTSARLPLVDGVFTHFERGENLTDLRGKLQDDLVRIRDILRQATGDSLIILNEIFTSTTLADALALSASILREVADLDAVCVCVTFIDELASANAKTVSVVAGVDPQDPTRRTFRIEPRPADGRAYAAALAAKHGLTYQRIVEVLGR